MAIMFAAVAEWFGVDELLGLSNKEPKLDTSRIRGPGVHKSGFLGKSNGLLTSKYRIQDKVGEGSFGTVRAVTHIATGKTAVCKVIQKNTSSAKDENIVRNEITILQTLDHPKIVRIFEYFEDDRSFLIVFEKLTGGDLQMEIDRSRRGINVKRVAHYMRQILLAINYCHTLAEPIIHRDLKPANVMKLTSGSRYSYADIKVIDFGLSAITQQSKNKVCGTPAFMAPECFEGKHSKAVDTWAVGMMTYYMLAKAMPFNVAHCYDIEAFERIIKHSDLHTFPEYQGWNRTSLRSAREFIMGTLRKNPAERWTAQQALNSNFIRSNASTPTFGWLRGPSKKLLCGLCNYALSPPVLRVSLLMAACKMDQSKMDKMKRHFEIVDRDCDGYISKQELGNLLQMGPRVPGRVVNIPQLLSSLDLNSDGRIGFSEFVAAWLYGRLHKDSSCLRYAFDAMDTDSDGWITQVDIFEGMKSSAAFNALSAPADHMREIANIFPPTPLSPEAFAATLIRNGGAPLLEAPKPTLVSQAEGLVRSRWRGRRAQTVSVMQRVTTEVPSRRVTGFTI